MKAASAPPPTRPLSWLPVVFAVSLIANAFQAMKICATNGIGTSVHETMDSIDLCLDGVIYSEGFNRDTFIKTLDSLSECEEKIKALIGGAGS